MPARRLLIDCDPGVDDALALILAFAGADVRAPAVTTVAGNAPVHISTRNALRVLAIACPQDAPPVHQGAAGPLSGIERDRALHVHGEDGLGNLDPRRYPDPSAGPVPPPAPEAILHWARRLPDEITLVATGPLTNVAAAVRSDPEGMRKLRGIVIMGGAVRVPG
ncbi:MAG: nucleoside hydrolase, partial [Nitrospinota bacterium]|nr:nucleoside hydrolase [Nitrospinota bacterium]